MRVGVRDFFCTFDSVEAADLYTTQDSATMTAAGHRATPQAMQR
jgi:hypothetical protein